MEDRVLNEVRRNRPAARGSAGDDGMTIVELLIALVVVMIVFAGLAATMVASFSSIRNNEARVRAVALGNELVEEMATVPWNQLGMAIKDPDTDPEEFPDDGDGELIVWLDGDMNPAVKHPDDQESIERDGRSYEVQRWVTLVEEDDQPAMKRMVVIVSWEVGGRDSSIRTEGLRAPEPEELFDLEVDVVAWANYADNSAMWLHPSGPDSDSPDPDKFNLNGEWFTVTASLGIAPASIQLRFTDRAGNERTRPGSDTEGGEKEREWTIAKHDVPFPHGRTTFTVFATGPDGQIASDTATLRFYEDLEIQVPADVTQDGDDVPLGGDVRVNEDGELCEPLRVEVDVHGMSAGEAVPNAEDEGGLTLEWLDGDDTPQVTVMALLGERQAFGGRFWAEIGVDSLQASDGEALSFGVSAHRLPPSDHPDVEVFDDSDSWEFTATAVEAC